MSPAPTLQSSVANAQSKHFPMDLGNGVSVTLSDRATGYAGSLSRSKRPDLTLRFMTNESSGSCSREMVRPLHGDRLDYFKARFSLDCVCHLGKTCILSSTDERMSLYDSNVQMT